jgi:hypothetical protein
VNRVLGVRTELDSILGVVAPLGLAAAAGTASLLIDLEPSGPTFPGERSLADLVSEGPRRVELAPAGETLAVMRNGGVAWEKAAETIDRLAMAWPALVLRVPAATEGMPWPILPVVPLFPGILAVSRSRAAVWQLTTRGQRPPGPGPTLPPLSRAAISALLEFHEVPTGKWVRAWQPVWELPWP